MYSFLNLFCLLVFVLFSLFFYLAIIFNGRKQKKEKKMAAYIISDSRSIDKLYKMHCESILSTTKRQTRIPVPVLMGCVVCYWDCFCTIVCLLLL